VTGLSRKWLVGASAAVMLGAVLPGAQAATVAAPQAATVAATRATAVGPLTGIVIAIDPGHQLGNSNLAFGRQLSQTYFVGGSVGVKFCNTTGTATSGPHSLAESTYNFYVAQDLRAALQRLGATVVMTRTVDSWNAWGPCVWNRGAFGGLHHAALEVSIHADGGPTWGRGFFVIEPSGITVPCYKHPRPARMVPLSRALGGSIIRGMQGVGLRTSNYITGGVLTEGNQATLNCSSVPTVIVETLNMPNSTDAALARSAAGRAKVALGLLRGIRLYLRR